MAASARPVQDAPPPRRASAPVVPLRPRRGPTGAQVRRRRATALAGLVALLGLVLVAAFARGGGGSPATEITTLLERGSAAPPTLCAHLSSGMLAAIGGREGCLRASPARGPAGRVAALRVHGDRATATVRSNAGDEAVRLVRQGGAWKVDDVR